MGDFLGQILGDFLILLNYYSDGPSANAAGDDLYDDVLAAGASSSDAAVKDEKSSSGGGLRSPSGDRASGIREGYPGRKYQGSVQQSRLSSQFCVSVLQFAAALERSEKCTISS